MKIFKYLTYPILIPILYILTAYILTFFSANTNSLPHKQNQTIYISYSDIHSDIGINIEKSEQNWQKLFPNLLKNREKGYLLFGWGDKETYLNTPTWNDLKLSTALKALFINTPSLMHVTYVRDIHLYKHKIIKVGKKGQYRVEKKILESFGKSITAIEQGYGRDDFFYNSPYKYNMFKTCNSWTGDVLRDSNIKVSYWTPFSYNVVGSIKK